ncbi:hypothetical protein D3C72_799370 [compost metagenome]
MTRDAEHTPSPQSVVVTDPLWMMHVIGPDDIYPAPDHATAVQSCAYLNSEIAPKVPSVLCVAVPAIWTGTAEEHAEGLAEAIKGWTVPAAPAPSSLAGGEWSQDKHDYDALTCIAAHLRDNPAHPFSGRQCEEFVQSARDALFAALSPEAPAREATAFAMNGPMTTHATLRSANIARQDEWDQDGQITASYRGNELAGEVGEACNVIKKLERERLGILGSRATVGELADELADVLICADLIAMHYGIDLEAAVARKFNATSEKVGLQTRLAAPNDGGEE